MTQARAQINSFMTALGAYKLDTGTFPTTEQGLQALRVRPENINNWQAPICRKTSRRIPGATSILINSPASTATSRT